RRCSRRASNRLSMPTRTLPAPRLAGDIVYSSVPMHASPGAWTSARSPGTVRHHRTRQAPADRPRAMLAEGVSVNSARFHDYFSRVWASYARFRPTYPTGLFETVARYAPALNRAWDCATGSGQAALGLSRLFREVIATDASPQQIGTAHAVSNVEYRVAPAE